MVAAHIANHYLQACIRGAQRQGFTSAELFKDTGVTCDMLGKPDVLLTESQLTAVIKSVWRQLRDEWMGCAVTPAKNGCFALMIELCASKPNLGAFLDQSARFYSTVSNVMSIGFDERRSSRDLLFFEIHLRDDSYDQDHVLQEYLLLMWQRLACWAISKRIPFVATQFSYAAPSHIKEYASMYPGEHHFNRKRCGFYVPEKFLDMPIVKQEEDFLWFLNESPAPILHRLKDDLSITATITSLLKQHNYLTTLTLEQVCEKICLTPRTVCRKLKDEGTSFSQIKDASSASYAIKLLSNPHTSIADVGMRLGFSEACSFSRAFKRWTGEYPSQWRQKHLTEMI